MSKKAKKAIQEFLVTRKMSVLSIVLKHNRYMHLAEHNTKVLLLRERTEHFI